MSNLVPHDWDWNQVHPMYGTPLMAMVNEGLRLGEHCTETARFWTLLRWCLTQGADPRTEAMGVLGVSAGWGGTDQFPQLHEVKHASHSAISLVLAIKASCKQHAKAYASQIKNADIMLSHFAKFAPNREGRPVVVAEAVVDMWESVLGDDSHSDVQLCAMGPCGSAENGRVERMRWF